MHRHGYMNPAMFIVRAVVYFAIWMVFAYFLNQLVGRWKIERGDQTRALAALSAPGLIVYVFTGHVFARWTGPNRWSTHWFSTIWGFLFVVGAGLDRAWPSRS